MIVRKSGKNRSSLPSMADAKWKPSVFGLAMTEIKSSHLDKTFHLWSKLAEALKIDEAAQSMTKMASVRSKKIFHAETPQIYDERKWFCLRFWFFVIHFGWWNKRCICKWTQIPQTSMRLDSKTIYVTTSSFKRCHDQWLTELNDVDNKNVYKDLLILLLHSTDTHTHAHTRVSHTVA